MTFYKIKIKHSRSEKNNLKYKIGNLYRRRKNSGKKKNRKKYLRSVIATCQKRIREKDREFKFQQVNIPIYPESYKEVSENNSKSDDEVSEEPDDWFIKGQIRFINRLLED